LLISNTTVCRASAGTCDVAEYCNNQGLCPGDTVLPSSTVCRASQGPCDLSEYCPGTSGVCPANVYVTDGTLCDDNCTVIILLI
jgi:hypothetical protein